MDSHTYAGITSNIMAKEDGYIRHYDCVEIVIPKEDDAYGGCPLGRENCYECEHMIRGGTLGGEPWIDCDVVGE